MDAEHVQKMSKRLLDKFNANLDHVIRNGDAKEVSYENVIRNVCRHMAAVSTSRSLMLREKVS